MPSVSRRVGVPFPDAAAAAAEAQARRPRHHLQAQAPPRLSPTPLSSQPSRRRRRRDSTRRPTLTTRQWSTVTRRRRAGTRHRVAAVILRMGKRVCSCKHAATPSRSLCCPCRTRSSPRRRRLLLQPVMVVRSAESVASVCQSRAVFVRSVVAAVTESLAIQPLAHALDHINVPVMPFNHLRGDSDVLSLSSSESAQLLMPSNNRSFCIAGGQC